MKTASREERSRMLEEAQHRYFKQHNITDPLQRFQLGEMMRLAKMAGTLDGFDAATLIYKQERPS